VYLPQPAGLLTGVENPRHGKGHINHSLFWKNLAPAKEGGGRLHDGKLRAALERDFGSVDEFKKQMNTTTAGIQGSGWGWLGYSPKTKKLEIVTTPNQDPLLSACADSSLLPFSSPLSFFLSVANRALLKHMSL
jgi:superoxide dismutase